MKIGILQKYNSKVEALADVSTINKLWYAERNGYVFIDDKNDYILEQGRSDTWLIELSLMNAILEHPECDWFFWTDIDSLIMDYDFKLESLISKAGVEHNIIACMWPIDSMISFSDLQADKITVIKARTTWFFVHTGNILVRNCKWSYDFLRMLYEDKRFLLQPELRDHVIGDEIGITTYYLGYLEYRKHIKILDSQLLLTIPNRIPQSTIKPFREGDFIFHVPLQPVDVKDETLRKYVKKCKR